VATALKQLGVTDEHLHTDRGRTGRNRERPGLTAALGAVRDGDVLVVTKLDRLGRSVRDLHDIAAELAGKGVKLSIGGSIHDPGDPIGKMFFGMLALMAEFESDLIRSRTVESMREAAKRGRLWGKPSKLSVLQRKRLLADYESGEYSAAQLMDISGLSRSAMYAGAVDPGVTQSNLPQTICRSGYSSSVRAPATETDKAKQGSLRQYGETPTKTTEYDHLISLELGGTNATSNLWPEPNATTATGTTNPKDSVENQLHSALCSGTITLVDAQKAIATDWTTAMAAVRR